MSAYFSFQDKIGNHQFQIKLNYLKVILVITRTSKESQAFNKEWPQQPSSLERNENANFLAIF